MSFIIQRVSGSALVMDQIETNLLRVGRGTNCDLRSENPSVALVHAEIVASSAGYTIVDKGSVTGTYVNRKAEQSALLSKGDEIEIGDLRMEVLVADADKPLFLRVSSLAAPEAAIDQREAKAPVSIPKVVAGGTVRPEKIDFAAAYRLRRPYLTKLAVASLLLIIVLLAISEALRPERQSLLMPGTVSSAHIHARDAKGNPIANNCAMCHDPWHSVTDAKCMACHGRAPHAERQAESPSCMSCHFEHRNQPKLAMVSDTKCVACHRDLRIHVVGSAPLDVAAHITGFGIDHPAFKPISDPDTLRFNHKRHLRKSGLKDSNGKREILSCQTCHKFVESRGKIDPVPPTFETACQRCHRLTFDDEHFPNVEVPHGGDSTVVYGFILTNYAGGNMTPEVIKRAMTTTEEVMNTTCGLCHPVARQGQRLVATAPVIPALWLQPAKFTHTFHRNIDCEACHKQARTSAATADVLIPHRDTCVPCHGPLAATAPSSCATCHVYHERSRLLMMSAVTSRTGRSAPPSAPLTGDVTGMLQTVLLYAIVILMLVVLIPVALALYSRLKAPAERPATAERAAPAVPPPAPASAVPPPPGEERARPTQIVDMKEVSPAPAGTELIRWNGMLLCTSGPLQGQRFMIPDEGLWIGREPALAQIVIDDARISKRHVRIVPRNGRVYASDTESTNGTFIDKVGERIREVELKRGNTVILGDNVACFRYEI
jgi:pSer/pThr/pTyr-binding forkhead associated (FHA) protein